MSVAGCGFDDVGWNHADEKSGELLPECFLVAVLGFGGFDFCFGGIISFGVGLFEGGVDFFVGLAVDKSGLDEVDEEEAEADGEEAGEHVEAGGFSEEAAEAFDSMEAGDAGDDGGDDEGDDDHLEQAHEDAADEGSEGDGTIDEVLERLGCVVTAGHLSENEGGEGGEDEGEENLPVWLELHGWENT